MTVPVSAASDEQRIREIEERLDDWAEARDHGDVFATNESLTQLLRDAAALLRVREQETAEGATREQTDWLLRQANETLALLAAARAERDAAVRDADKLREALRKIEEMSEGHPGIGRLHAIARAALGAEHAS